MKTRLLSFVLPAAIFSFMFAAAACAAIDAPQYAAGDTWRYQEVNGYNHLVLGSFTQTVSAATPAGINVDVRAGDGRLLYTASLTAPGLLASGVLTYRVAGPLKPALQLVPFPLEEGKRWEQKVTRFDPSWQQMRTVSLYGKVEGWETVKVPAGEFRALKIVREMFLGDHDNVQGQTKLTQYEWYVPELKHWVKLQTFEEYHLAGDNVGSGSYYQGDRNIFELTSYQPAAK